MVEMIVQAIRIGAVFLFGSTGETVIEKSGHLNLGIPGTMCLGAVGGCIGANLAYNGGASHGGFVIMAMLMAMLFLKPIAERLHMLHKKQIFTLRMKVTDRTCVNRIVDTINDHECDITAAKIGEDNTVTVTLAKTTEDMVDGICGALIKISKVQDVEIINGVSKNENQ